MNIENAIALLYIIIFFPIICSGVLLFLPEKFSRQLGWVGTLVPLIACIFLFGSYVTSPDTSSWVQNGYHLFHSVSWLSSPGFSIQFSLGIDGISLFLVLFAVLLFPLIVLFKNPGSILQAKLFYMMLLILETGILGFFLSLDLFFFYVFFELVLIPTYFFIGIWGDEHKKNAALKFFLYTIVGSFLMLIAIIYLGLNANPGQFTTDYFSVLSADLTTAEQNWLFLGFFIAFAIKIPIFPFHTWQPLTYSSSSTTGTIILAALLSKMGAYGLIRFCLPLFPEASVQFAPFICGLAIIGVIYGALLAVGQQDLKRLFAYSSFSHLGFIVLGIFAMNTEALSGAVLHMTGHGIVIAAIFFLIDSLQRSTGTRSLNGLQGVASVNPKLAFALMISILASAGLPGLSGFIGEFIILIGSYSSDVIPRFIPIIAAISVILSAVYLLDMFRRAMFGNLYMDSLSETKDLSPKEVVIATILIIFMFAIGIYATPFLSVIEQDLDHVLTYVQPFIGN